MLGDLLSPTLPPVLPTTQDQVTSTDNTLLWTIRDFGQRVRSWWWTVKATQEGKHVNVITQFTCKTNMKF